MNFLSIENVEFKYLQQNFQYNFELHKNQLTYLCGKNGSGKTTILNIIAGFIEPDAGKIFLDGAEITKTPAKRRNLAILFTAHNLFPRLDAFSNVMLGISKTLSKTHENLRIVNEIFEKFGIEKLSAKMPCEMSAGEKRKVEIARISIMNRKLLLLDEPLSYLDEDSARFFEQFFYDEATKNGKTILMSTHNEIRNSACKIIKI